MCAVPGAIDGTVAHRRARWNMPPRSVGAAWQIGFRRETLPKNSK